MTDQIARTWDEALANFVGFCSSLNAATWERASTCPGWSIADLVSHTIDLESMLAGDPRPDYEPDWSALPHVDSPFGRLTEVGVDFRRGRTPEELLDELGQAHARALARVEELGPDASIPWLRGDTPLPQLLGMRTFDIWMHEQDARVATGAIGNLDGPGAVDAMTYLTAGLPKVWGKGTRAPIGSVLHLTITEPGLTGDYWVRVQEDARASLVDECESNVQVTLPWLAFVMLAGGRDTETDFADAVVISGDEALGRAFLDAVAVTP